MKFPHRLFAGTVVGIALLAFFGVPQAGPSAFSPDSYYQIDVPLQFHDGTEADFAAQQGKYVIVSMFYGSCPHVCPMLINSIKQVEHQLEPAMRQRLQVLMVTVDPERDDPQALAALAQQHGVDRQRWKFARTVNANDTRALAAVLDIKYKRLPDGQFNHTSVMILLDETGREVTRSSKLGKPDPVFVEKVREAL